MYCSECGSAVPETAKFCAACGSGVTQSDPGATIAGAEGETLAPNNAPRARSGATPPRTPKAASNPSGVLSSSDAIGGGRFAPGTVLGIASLLANVLLNLPFTLDFSYWYATQCFFIVLLFVAIGVWGAYTSLGGKPIFGKSILED
jgi:hypothetical protein